MLPSVTSPVSLSLLSRAASLDESRHGGGGSGMGSPGALTASPAMRKLRSTSPAAAAALLRSTSPSHSSTCSSSGGGSLFHQPLSINCGEGGTGSNPNLLHPRARRLSKRSSFDSGINVLQKAAGAAAAGADCHHPGGRVCKKDNKILPK